MRDPVGLETDMAQDEKPELTLIPGAFTFSAEAIAEFYTKLTGKKPSETEMEEVRKYLKDHMPAP